MNIFEDYLDKIKKILLDLSKRETLNQSSSLVNFLIKSFKKDMN